MSLFDFLRKWSGRLEQEEAAEPALETVTASDVEALATKVPHSKTQHHRQYQGWQGQGLRRDEQDARRIAA